MNFEGLNAFLDFLWDSEDFSGWFFKILKVFFGFFGNFENFSGFFVDFLEDLESFFVDFCVVFEVDI